MESDAPSAPSASRGTKRKLPAATAGASSEASPRHEPVRDATAQDAIQNASSVTPPPPPRPPSDLGTELREAMYAISSKSDARHEALRQELARVRTENAENLEKVANLEADAARLRSYANQSHKQVLRDCAQLQRVCELEEALLERQAEGQRLRADLDAARAAAADLESQNQALEASRKRQADSAQGLGRQCEKLQAEKARLQSMLEGSLLARGAPTKTKTQGEAASEAELSFIKRAAARQKVTLQRKERQLAEQQRELGLLRQQLQQHAQQHAQQSKSKSKSKSSHKKTARRRG